MTNEPCPLCGETNPSEFGISRSRKDGRSPYCKACIRRKVYACRAGKRRWQAVQAERAAARKATPVDRVRNAIRQGARTQAEIARTAKVFKDELGDALAVLLLWNHEITTREIDGTRMYFPINVVEVERKPCKPATPMFTYLQCLGPRAKGVAA